MREMPSPYLAPRTTLRVGGTAIAELVLEHREDIALLPERLRALGGTPLVLGAGSNILARDGELPLVLVRPQFTDGPEIAGERDGKVLVRAGAGVPMEEILYLVDQTLVRSGYKDMIGAGVVLTGGTALIEGCQELGEQIFNLPTRIGYPRNVGGLKDVVNSPKFSTAVGLLRYGAEKELSGQKKFTTRSESGVFDGVLSRMVTPELGGVNFPLEALPTQSLWQKEILHPMNNEGTLLL